jgi:hypothetical protein
MTTHAVRCLLPLACLLYAAAAIMGRQAWISAGAAVLAAWLLWRRGRRARFAAYIFFSVAAARSLRTPAWPELAFAILGVLVLQTPAARGIWPRVTSRWRVGASTMPKRPGEPGAGGPP